MNEVNDTQPSVEDTSQRRGRRFTATRVLGSWEPGPPISPSLSDVESAVDRAEPRGLISCDSLQRADVVTVGA